MAVERADFSALWKDAVIAAFLCDGEADAEQMEVDADALDSTPESQGIANLLRDRASDIRRQRRHGDATPSRPFRDGVQRLAGLVDRSGDRLLCAGVFALIAISPGWR